MSDRRPARQRGMALVAALFLIVVLAALGLYAVRVTTMQQRSVDLALLASRARAAARSGLEYGANRALRAASCPVATTLNLSQAGLRGFSVTVGCTLRSYVVGPSTYHLYTLDAFAWYGRFGTPNYVSSQLRSSVNDVP